MVFKRYMSGQSGVSNKKRKTVGYRKNNVKQAKKYTLNKDVHFFRRSYAQIAPGSFSGNVSYAPFLGGYSFSLSQLPGVADFTTLFDRYMITHVQLRFYLKIDPSAQTASAASFPKLYFVKDYDDSTAATSLDALREHNRCQVRVLYPNRPIIVNIKPSVLSEVYRGVATTTYSPKWKQWIDMANTDVPHYGLKWGIDDFTNTNYKVDIEGKMWFSCKDQR